MVRRTDTNSTTRTFADIIDAGLTPEDKRGKKDIMMLLIIDVIFTMAVFFLFRYGFKIVLPAGIFTINL